MKFRPTYLLTFSLLTAGLTGCGSQAGALVAPRALVHVQTAKPVQVSSANLLLRAGYSPNQNNSHYGFDLASVSFVDARGRSWNLNLSYYSATGMMWITLREQGAAPDVFEHIDGQNTTRRAELARQLRSLRGGTSADQAALNQVAAVLERTLTR